MMENFVPCVQIDLVLSRVDNLEARMATMVENFNHLLRVQVDLNLSCVDNLEARMAINKAIYQVKVI